MHKQWKNNLIGLEPAENGKERREIDESKIVTYNNSVKWMFGLVDRTNREIRIVYVGEDLAKAKLMPIIKQNVYISVNSIHNNSDDNLIDSETRIYSDYIATQLILDFNRCGYILNKLNHTYWFGYGSFHTNTIEGVWSKIKLIRNNFAGISGPVISELSLQGISKRDYFNDWIFYFIYLIKCEKLKLCFNAKKEYVSNLTNEYSYKKLICFLIYTKVFFNYFIEKFLILFLILFDKC